ncbi:MAG: hypothetical protein K0Q52_1898 [Microbacterium sp.]|jgi:hypothetical protein|nr:hypothetical protein [Microbacterium sp.]
MIRIPAPDRLQLVGVELPADDLGSLAWLVGAIAGAVLLLGCCALAWMLGAALGRVADWAYVVINPGTELVAWDPHDDSPERDYRQVSACACPNPAHHAPWCDSELELVRGRL